MYDKIHYKQKKKKFFPDIKGKSRDMREKSC